MHGPPELILREGQTVEFNGQAYRAVESNTGCKTSAGIPCALIDVNCKHLCNLDSLVFLTPSNYLTHRLLK